FSGRRRYFTSPTTPTIDNHWLSEVERPSFMRLPIASCPGQNRWTKPSLTITAGDGCVASVSLNVRPLSIGIPSVAKKLGVTRWRGTRALSVASQRFDWIDSCCPSRRHEAGRESRRSEERGNPQIGNRIEGTDAIGEASDDLRRAERADETDRQAGEHGSRMA